MAISALREQEELARNLHDVASNQQVSNPLCPNGFRYSAEPLATKNQVKGIRLLSRPWKPQDLLDDLQLIIDEEPDRYLNDKRTTLCMARDFLKEHFAESGWISVKDRLPEERRRVLAFVPGQSGLMGKPDIDTDRVVNGRWVRWGEYVTHWMPLPEPPIYKQGR